MKKALTMIELIAVIVILGILAAGSTKIFIQVYKNYAVANYVTELESKTSAVMDVLNAKLRKRFKESLRYRCDVNSTETKQLKDVIAGQNICKNKEPEVLEWVMKYDKKFYKQDATDSSVYRPQFCFSGVVDMGRSLQDYATKRTNIHTDIKIYDVDFTKSNSCFQNDDKVGVYFLDTNYSSNFIEDVLLSGVIGNDNSIVISKNDNKKKSAISISSVYQLAKTAQAVALEDPKEYDDPNDPNAKITLYNMYLYYDYQPWHNDAKTAAGGISSLSDLQGKNLVKKALLAENVSQFRTIQYGKSVGIDICIDNPKYIVTGQDKTTKKEKKQFLRVCKVGGAI